MANPDPRRVQIASLRWPVTLAQRPQQATGLDTITETLLNPITVHADIQPIGAVTFFAGQQTDRPITHRVRIRYLDWLDETWIVQRTTNRPDGTQVTEIFRVRRVKDVDGRKRFMELEVEQERRL